MTIVKPRTIPLPSVASLLGAARGYFQTSDAPFGGAVTPQVAVADTAIDQIRYAQLLETELDRQTFTHVEREDSDMLDRMRTALYAD